MWLSKFYTTKYTISIHVLSTDLKSIMTDTWKSEYYLSHFLFCLYTRQYLQSIRADGYVFS